ncbi:MAG: vanadium-dependent haloperoxidase [Aquabacterium sp.]|nr:vanadium-dependent haloperoxidase [Aquabacterium sp.]
MQRRNFLTQSAAVGAALAASNAVQAGTVSPGIVVQWNRVMLQAVQTTVMPVTIAARAMAMVHEAIYNAWAHYDKLAYFTQPWLSKRLALEWNSTNKRLAISHAAHGVLTDLFPGQVQSLFDPLLQASTADAWTSRFGGSTADDVGRNAAWRVIQSRNNDGANMRGDLAPGAYSDWTGYQSVNTPDLVTDIDRWQPLRLPNAAGVLTVQRFLTPHWGRVRPFALKSGDAFRPGLHPRGATKAEIDEVIRLSAELTDRSKAQGDFFAQNPGSVTPPGQWLQIAEQVSQIDRNTLDKDVKLFFTTAQACLDASIAAWDAKRFHDQSRPFTVIPVRFRGRPIRAWGGPGRGTQHIHGERWVTWQRPVNRTPPFPDFVSGHSTFSAAAATAICKVRGSDHITLTATVPRGSFRTDPGLPAADITFIWRSLSEVADAAGLSRRITGLHWERSDLEGRALGRKVGGAVAHKALELFDGPL